MLRWGMMFASSTSPETPTMRRGAGLMSANLIRGSVHMMCRLTASCPGNSCCAMLLQTSTAGA